MGTWSLGTGGIGPLRCRGHCDAEKAAADLPVKTADTGRHGETRGGRRIGGHGGRVSRCPLLGSTGVEQYLFEHSLYCPVVRACSVRLSNSLFTASRMLPREEYSFWSLVTSSKKGTTASSHSGSLARAGSGVALAVLEEANRCRSSVPAPAPTRPQLRLRLSWLSPRLRPRLRLRTSPVAPLGVLCEANPRPRSMRQPLAFLSPPAPASCCGSDTAR